MQTNNRMKRAIVIQGGGCKGAYAAGEIAERIDKGYTWDEYYGTSAGALVATLASLNSSELLKTAFTTMSNKDVWSKMPIKNNGKIKITNLLMKIIFSKNALGSTSNLRKTLPKFFTLEDYNKLRDSFTEVVACSVNYSVGDIAYGRNDYLDYETFLDAVWASTCVPILCDPVKINGQYFQDGGLLMNTPIQRAINNGCDEVDVFMLNPKSSEYDAYIIGQEEFPQWEGKNMIGYAGRSVQLMMNHISATNLNVAKLKALDKDVKLRFHYPDGLLLENAIDAMIFDKKRMSKLYEMGINKAKKSNTSEKIYLKA